MKYKLNTALFDQNMEIVIAERGEVLELSYMDKARIDKLLEVKAIEEVQPISATKAARDLAHENYLNLDEVEPTGKNGKVLVGDVRKALEVLV